MSMIDISKAVSNNAYMQIAKLPEVNYFVKTIQFPNITGQQTIIPVKQHYQWKIPSIHSQLEDITIMYYLDEHYKTYFALLKWMAEIREKDIIKETMSDITITILNNAKQPIIKVNIVDAWPTNCGPLDFDTVSVDPLVPIIMFSFTTLEWSYVDGSLSGRF